MDANGHRALRLQLQRLAQHGFASRGDIDSPLLGDQISQRRLNGELARGQVDGEEPLQRWVDGDSRGFRAVALIVVCARNRRWLHADAHVVQQCLPRLSDLYAATQRRAGNEAKRPDVGRPAVRGIGSSAPIPGARR